MRNTQAVANVDASKVVKVYSGKANACACGCSGKYSYASQFRDVGSKGRGYKVDDDEVSDRSVKLIVNKLNKAGPVTDVDKDGNAETDYAFAIVGERIYVAYFV